MSWVALIGEAISKHEDWCAALVHVAALYRINTAALWFQDSPEGAWIFDGPPETRSIPSPKCSPRCSTSELGAVATLNFTPDRRFQLRSGTPTKP